MPNLLLSGPAGAGKSTTARKARDEMSGPAVIADFTAIHNALTMAQRGPDGRFPDRTDRDLLPLAETIRQDVIRTAVERDIGVVATNSDGDARRRQYLLRLLGPGAGETVIDPGRDVVRERLADPVTGVMSDECGVAFDRWYARN